MLTITVPGKEHYDEENNRFFTIDDVVLDLEHSLVTVSKWEEIYEKPFLDMKEKTDEELFTYVRLMVQTPNIPVEVLRQLSSDNIGEINAYINAKMSATWFNEKNTPSASREIITAELIYYWMNAFSIPIECQHWHLQKLFTLIKVHSAKQEKPKKMSRDEILQRNRELNAKRKAELGTSG